MIPGDEESKINYSTIEKYMRAKDLKNIISILKNEEN